MPAARILSNFASAFFLTSGCWGDLLLIRVFLTCAYTCLVALSFVADLQLENYIWGFVCLYLHGSSVVRLFFDEGPVKLDEKKEQEALWHFFYRRSGISCLLFKSYVAPCFELVEEKTGTVLDTNNYFYIILDGAIRVESEVAGLTRDLTLASGESFGIKHLKPLFWGKSTFTEKSQRLTHFINQNINAKVSADAKLYRCSDKNMEDLCSHPQSKDASQGLLIAILSDIVERQYMENPALHSDGITKDNTDEESQFLESAKPTLSSTRSALFSPLEHFEEPDPNLAGSGSFKGIHRHILHTLKAWFLLPWPLMAWRPGLRQVGSLPIPKASACGEEKETASKEPMHGEKRATSTLTSPLLYPSGDTSE